MITNNDLTVTIRRYGNRKYYIGSSQNPLVKSGQWATLSDIGRFVRLGTPIRVICTKTRNDITGEVLQKVIAWNEEKSRLAWDVSSLERVIRKGNGTFSQFVRVE